MPQDRRMAVLRAVVEEYIRTQEPVSSAAVARGHAIDASPATVRNDMAALEDEGYLEQPHTSAGRVPTDKGYRVFVDRLATAVPLSAAQRNAIASFLAGSVSLEDVLRRSAQLLATITGQVAVVASPSLARSTLRHVETVPLGPSAALVVVITDTGRVEQRALALRGGMPPAATMARVTERANAACHGQGLAQTGAWLREAAAAEEDQAARDFASALADTFTGLASQERTSNLYLSGASALAHGGAGAQQDIAPLLDALEEQVVLMRLMGNLSEQARRAGRVGVAIGSETHTPALLRSSVVSSGYGHSAEGAGGADAPVAFVGSIGPTHMDYQATIAAVRAVATYLTEYVAREEGEGPGGPDGAGKAGERPPET